MFEMNEKELEMALQVIESSEKEKSERKSGPSFRWTGLNTGEKVIRFLTKKLPQFRSSPKDAKYVWVSRILNLEGNYRRVFWPTIKQSNGIPIVDPNFILYKALMTIKREVPKSPILANKREGRRFGEYLLPRLRVVSNVYDREKNEVTILCEKTWINNEGIEYSIDLGVTSNLMDQILKEVVMYRKTLDIDIYIHRYLDNNKVLYSIRDYLEEKKPLILSKYGKKEEPIFKEEDLFDIDEITKEITNEGLKEFEHIIELYNRISKKENVNDIDLLNSISKIDDKDDDLEYLKSKYKV